MILINEIIIDCHGLICYMSHCFIVIILFVLFYGEIFNAVLILLFLFVGSEIFLKTRIRYPIILLEITIYLWGIVSYERNARLSYALWFLSEKDHGE
jgi:hypothetical protein